jgi:transcription elongation factor GreA
MFREKAMSDKTMYMTERGFAKLQKQIDLMRNIELPELAEALHEAQVGGDTMDNTEYIILREELAFLESRIRELTEILNHAQLIERGESDGKVHLGNTVVVQVNGDMPETYTIVGSVETNPSDGYISYESPLGAALLDHEVGDDVTVQTPEGELCFRIIAVT